MYMLKNLNMKVLISCGGTGGHIYPGVAIAQEFTKNNHDVFFIGAQNKIEMNIIPKYDYSIYGLPIEGINRYQLLENIFLPYKILNSLFKAKKIISSEKPDIIIGTGGYASFIPTLTGIISHIPVYIQEQNAVPGLINKIIGRYCKTVFSAFDDVKNYYPDKTKIFNFGNPIRSFPLVNREEAYRFFNFSSRKKTILVLSGSGGAESIAKHINEIITKLLYRDIQIIVIAGKYISLVTHNHDNLYVKEYMENIHLAYTISDLIISRSGALSLTEISYMKKPAIIIPSPNVANDHQLKNAISFDKKNAIVLLEEQNINTLYDVIINTLFNEDLLKQLSDNISLFSRYNSATKIYSYIINDTLNNGNA